MTKTEPDLREQLIVALTRPNHQFTRAEVALLMATAYRWGYEQRSDEELENYLPIDFSATELIRDLERKARRDENDRFVREQMALREESDRAAREQAGQGDQ